MVTNFFRNRPLQSSLYTGRFSLVVAPIAQPASATDFSRFIFASEK
jgi:hypothetical protein